MKKTTGKKKPVTKRPPRISTVLNLVKKLDARVSRLENTRSRQIGFSVDAQACTEIEDASLDDLEDSGEVIG